MECVFIFVHCLVCFDTSFCRFLTTLLGDLSSQVASAEAASGAARSIAESLLKKARIITPHHRLLLHDHVLLSSPLLEEVQGECELLEDGALQDAARLVRDSLAVFPLKVS
jgi:hypothetical protein